MYSIRKSYLNFNKEIEYCLSLLKIKEHSKELFIDKFYDDEKRVYVQSSAVINRIWQTWNSYWRNYWLTHFYGGKGLNTLIPSNNLKISEVASIRIPEEEAIYFILSAAGWKLRKNGPKRIEHYQEPTWGDIKTITKVASAFVSTQHNVQLPGDRVMGALSVLGDSLNDLQLVRNCSIHLSKNSINELKIVVTPKYNISTFKYPTELMYSERVATSQIAFDYWMEELTTFLDLLE